LRVHDRKIMRCSSLILNTHSSWAMTRTWQFI